ncbi:EthD family reductase [Kangiella sp. TOML190]|uniref:EthD family reductase n=1 Tax=Kangiella sp. TOML190 TaxID=2931351 RepID=UPI0025599D7D|nr:EthD family reductase [Kangiella sp. TOML190]
MIKVSVMYPNSSEATFDVNYYLEKHMPMVSDLLGESLKDSSVDLGITSGENGEPPIYVAIAHMSFDSVDAFKQSFGANLEQIQGDTVNFTDITPEVQISEIR